MEDHVHDSLALISHTLACTKKSDPLTRRLSLHYRIVLSFGLCPSRFSRFPYIPSRINSMVNQALVALPLVLAGFCQAKLERKHVSSRLSQHASRSSVATVSGATYLGCFSDPSNSRTLSYQAYSSSTNTPAACAAACPTYQYFGVEYGKECWCSNSFGNPSTGSCNMVCAGKSRLHVRATLN